MPDKQHVRLNSWKEIAAYLDHDVRTVIRWEKERGMPVHRVPGGKGHGVFAFSGEINEWLVSDGKRSQDLQVLLEHPRPAPVAPNSAVAPLAKVVSSVPSPSRAEDTTAPTTVPIVSTHLPSARPSPIRISFHARIGLTAITAATVIAAVVFFAGNGPSAPVSMISWKDNKLIAWNESKGIQWVRDFPPHHNIPLLANPDAPGYVGDLDGDGSEEIVVGADALNGKRSNPEWYCFSRSGQLLWRFTPDDRLSFGEGDYRPPWGRAAWNVHRVPGNKRIVLAMTHEVWWPSLLILLDAQGRVVDRFVNSGWIYEWYWVERAERSLLLVSGVSNSNSCGMMAVIDGSHASGSSPEERGSPYECKNCPPGRPLRYFVFPRSELNIAMGAEYNRAGIGLFQDRFVVSTAETDPGGITVRAKAMYEFSPDAELQRANFNHEYWDLHRRLEFDGKIHHSQEHCPERYGPRLVRSWDPQNGWREIPLPRK